MFTTILHQFLLTKLFISERREAATENVQMATQFSVVFLLHFLMGAWVPCEDLSMALYEVSYSEGE